MTLTWLIYDCTACGLEDLGVDAGEATLTVWENDVRPPIVEFDCIVCGQALDWEPCQECVSVLVTCPIRVSHVRAPDEMLDTKRRDARPLTEDDLIDLGLSLSKG